MGCPPLQEAPSQRTCLWTIHPNWTPSPAPCVLVLMELLVREQVDEVRCEGRRRGLCMVRVTHTHQRLTASIPGCREGLWAEAEAPRDALRLWINRSLGRWWKEPLGLARGLGEGSHGCCAQMLRCHSFLDLRPGSNLVNLGNSFCLSVSVFLRNSNNAHYQACLVVKIPLPEA